MPTQHYNNFIVTGDSYSSGPIDKQKFPENAEQINPWPPIAWWEKECTSWSHYCLLAWDPSQINYVNFARPGGSNIAAMLNMIYYLESNPELTAANTLIGFNITAAGRWDSIGPPTEFIPTALETEDLELDIRNHLAIGWTRLQQPDWPTLDSDNYEQRSIQSCIAVITALAYLDQRGFDYFFMLLNTSVYADAPAWFQQALDQRRRNWIQFDNKLGMFEFVKSIGSVDHTDHPTPAGYRAIADCVLKHRNKHDR